ncbi:YlbF family regulator [Brevibacillus reuszeri]|uniref:YlbF family regulator n=1 Tax=Brevibacillus reuszeri TaxID=54915 RepID=UPI000CCC545A|nr:YlbF family regulator [Brevibacillus reuszeri]
MGAVVGITAYLQAKNQMSPEIQRVVKYSKSATKEIHQLDDATQDMIKEMRKIKQAAEQNERGFKREMDKMQQEVQQLKRQLGGLDSIRVSPKVNIDDQARREISAIRQEVKSLDGTKAKVEIEANSGAGGELATGGIIGAAAAYTGAGFIDRLTLETQANARRSLLGDTPEEILQFQQQSQDFSMINPNVDRTHIKDLMTQATRFDQVNGADITRQSLQLNAIRPDLGGVEEYQRTMFAMQQAWKEITDIGRFGDTLAEIANTTTDIRGEALDSIVEYSTQVTKFLDTPEKLAELTKEMNNLWSIDKGFDALKEATIKLDNQGDMVNVLKTAYEAQGLESDVAQKRAENESKTIATAIHSENTADNQFAVAALLQTFGGIQDQKVRQELLNELGAGPGEDISKAYAPLLQAAGRIGMTDASQFNYQGRLDQTFKKYQDNDPLRGFIEAKTMLSNELTSLGLLLAQDLGPTVKDIAEGIKKAKDLMDRAPIEATLTGMGLIVAGVTYGLWKFKVALAAAEAAAIRRALGGGMPDIDLPDGPDKKGKGGKGGKGGKRQWWNPLSWGGKEVAPKKNWLSSKDAADMAFGKGAPKEIPKSGWKETLKSVGGLLPKGDAILPGIKSAWEGVKSVSGSLFRKLPFIGAAIGAGQILTADDKLDMAGKVGSEALGGWGGAAAGAAIGSVVPGVGTAIGGIVGGIAGAFGGGALFDKVKSWWSDAPAAPPDEPTPVAPSSAPVLGPPIPVVSPVKKQEEKPKLTSLTISAMPITLKADGVLQDVAGMLRLLRDPTVSNEIKRIVEKAFIDSLETSGGVTT